VADAAGRPRHQHPVAGVHARQAQGPDRGDPRHRQGRGGHEVAGVRQRRGPGGGHRRPLGEGAAGLAEGYHPVADVELGHALAERGHRPGDVPAEHAAGRLRGGQADLAAVDRGGLDVDQELAGAWGGLGHVGDGQGGGGRRVGDDRAHARSFGPLQGWRRKATVAGLTLDKLGTMR